MRRPLKSVLRKERRGVCGRGPQTPYKQATRRGRHLDIERLVAIHAVLGVADGTVGLLNGTGVQWPQETDAGRSCEGWAGVMLSEQDSMALETVGVASGMELAWQDGGCGCSFVIHPCTTFSALHSQHLCIYCIQLL